MLCICSYGVIAEGSTGTWRSRSIGAIGSFKPLTLVTLAAWVSAAFRTAFGAAGLRATASGGSRRAGRHVALRHHRVLRRLLAARRFWVLASGLPAARRAVRRLRAVLSCSSQQYMYCIVLYWTVYSDLLYKFISVTHCTAHTCIFMLLSECIQANANALWRTCFGIQSVSTFWEPWVPRSTPFETNTVRRTRLLPCNYNISIASEKGKKFRIIRVHFTVALHWKQNVKILRKRRCIRRVAADNDRQESPRSQLIQRTLHTRKICEK